MSYADWSFLWHLTTCFPFMPYGLSYIVYIGYHTVYASQVGAKTACITIIDTIIHHILTNYTNDAYIILQAEGKPQPMLGAVAGRCLKPSSNTMLYVVCRMSFKHIYIFSYLHICIQHVSFICHTIYHIYYIIWHMAFGIWHLAYGIMA
jgi:hypothetical protein